MKRLFSGGYDKPALSGVPSPPANVIAGGGHGSKLSISSLTSGSASGAASGGAGGSAAIAGRSSPGLVHVPSPYGHSADISSPSSLQQQQLAARTRVFSNASAGAAAALDNASEQPQYFDRPFAPPEASGTSSRINSTMNVAGSGFLVPVSGQPVTPGSGGIPSGPPIPAYAVSTPSGDGFVKKGLASTQTPPQAAVAPNSFDRNDLHKSLKALENLLVSLDEYRDLAARMAKAEKRLAKAANELAKGKFTRDVPAQTLSVSASLIDLQNDVSAKHAKYVQKEYEALNESCAKYFKRVAKEEKNYMGTIESLDAKVKKAHAVHEKNASKSKSGPKAIESHDKYIASVSQLTSEIAAVKERHALSLGGKGHVINLAIASCIGGMADAEFRAHCERVRRTGPLVGRVNEWLNFATNEAMPTFQPPDCAGGEDEWGPAAALAAAQEKAELAAAQRRAVEEAAKETAQLEWAARQMGWVPPEELHRVQSAGTDALAAQLQQQHQQEREIWSATPSSSSQGRQQQDSVAGSVRSTASRSASLSSQPMGLLPRLDSNGQIISDNAADTSALDRSSTQKAVSSVATKPTPTVVAAATASTSATVSALASFSVSAAKPSAQSEAICKDHSKTHLRGQDSSFAEGTVIETPRLQPSQSDSDATPSLTNSNSRIGSDDPIPRTPNAHSSVVEDLLAAGALHAPSAPARSVAAAASETEPTLTNDKNSAVRVEGGLLGKFGFEQRASEEGEIGGNAKAAIQSASAFAAAVAPAPVVNAAAAAAAVARPSESITSETDKQSQEAHVRAASPPPLLDTQRPTSERPALGLVDGLLLRQSQQQGTSVPPGSYQSASGVGGTGGPPAIWERERVRTAEQDTSNGRPALRSPPPAMHTGDAVGDSPYRNAYDVGYEYTKVTPGYRSTGGQVAGVSTRAAAPASGVGAGPVAVDAPHERRGPSHPDLSYEATDRYAPAVGSSRIDGPTLHRNTSTDSERSFVARMKAKYQAEKLGIAAPATVVPDRGPPYAERDSARYYRNPADRAVSYGAPPPLAGRASASRSSSAGPRYSEPPPPRHSYDHHNGYARDDYRYASQSSRPPPDASAYDDRYGGRAAPPAAPLAADGDPPRRPHDSMPPPLSPGRSFQQGLSPLPSEFGSLRSDRSPPLQQQSQYAQRPTMGLVDDEPQHSSVCGCAKCSARHYGSGGGAAGGVGSGGGSSNRGTDPRRFTAPPPASLSASMGGPRSTSSDGRQLMPSSSLSAAVSGAYYSPRDQMSGGNRQSMPPPSRSAGAGAGAGAGRDGYGAPLPSLQGQAGPYDPESVYGRRSFDADGRRVA